MNMPSPPYCPIFKGPHSPCSQCSSNSCGDFEVLNSAGVVPTGHSECVGGWGLRDLNHYDVGASDTLSIGSCDTVSSRIRGMLSSVEDKGV